MANWKLLLASPLLVLCANTVQASSYIGLDWTSFDVENTIDDDLTPKGARLRLGFRFSDVFDIEAHLGSTDDNDSLVYDEFRLAFAGIYLKGYLPFGQRSALYAMGGMASTMYEQTINGRELSDSEADFSFGFGLETQLTHYLDLSADYMNYTSDIGGFSEVSAVNVGLKWYF